MRSPNATVTRCLSCRPLTSPWLLPLWVRSPQPTTMTPAGQILPSRRAGPPAGPSSTSPMRCCTTRGTSPGGQIAGFPFCIPSGPRRHRSCSTMSSPPRMCSPGCSATWVQAGPGIPAVSRTPAAGQAWRSRRSSSTATTSPAPFTSSCHFPNRSVPPPSPESSPGYHQT